MHMVSFVLRRDVYHYACGDMHEQRVFLLGRFLYGVRVGIPSLLGHLDPLKNTRLRVLLFRREGYGLLGVESSTCAWKVVALDQAMAKSLVTCLSSPMLLREKCDDQQGRLRKFGAPVQNRSGLHYGAMRTHVNIYHPSRHHFMVLVTCLSSTMARHDYKQ
jgi:hypothetical protein